MKTLIINGSTRRGGNTDTLVAEFTKYLDGEYMTVTYDDGIAPCRDCRYCMTHDGCAVNDRMENVYRYIEECDNIVIASPVWFMSLSSVTLEIASRLQSVWASVRRGGQLQKKNGVIMLVGAQEGTEVPAEKAARAILRTVGVKLPCAATVKAMRTDDIAVCDDGEALAAAQDAAVKLNEINKKANSKA